MNTPAITFQPLDVSNVCSSSQDLQRFREKHENWLAMGVCDDDGISNCLHPEHLDACLGLFKIDSTAREAEKELATLCDHSHAIGICQDRFVRYALLQPQPTWPSHLDLSCFLDLGWDQTDIATIKNLPDPTEKINRRLRSAAGRLICMPSFLAARDRIRETWLALPSNVRPLLPIARSVRAAGMPKLEVEPVPAAVAKFINGFDEFCNDWHLLGMASWSLPDVRGPDWVPGFADDKTLHDGKLTVTTPWHFHVLAEDGLGSILEAEHRRQATVRGIEDGGSWETYAHILDVYFWELVLSSRYGRAERVAKFKTTMDFVLAEILGLAVSRIKRLRTWASALRRGKLSSLAGKR